VFADCCPGPNNEDNGGVERLNRTFREDLYDVPGFTADTIHTVRDALHQALRAEKRAEAAKRFADSMDFSGG
jgi:hypothetical protein